jgi:hypothetical protein
VANPEAVRPVRRDRLYRLHELRQRLLVRRVWRLLFPVSVGARRLKAGGFANVRRAAGLSREQIPKIPVVNAVHMQIETHLRDTHKTTMDADACMRHSTSTQTEAEAEGWLKRP